MSLQGVTRYENLSISGSRSPRNGEFERSLNANDVRAISAQALAESKQGRLTESWRLELEAMDRSARFSRNALRIFQDLQAQLGIPTVRPILLPMNTEPFWHRGPHPFENYQSTMALPCVADVVIIGAGLTGVAAAYRLKDTDLRVVLLDQGDPACEASGRNGGNFELLPENSIGISLYVYAAALPPCTNGGLASGK
jgi:hypothetical protein